MNRRTFRLVVILGTLSIIGIIIIQIYWVRKAFDIREKQFNQTISIGLKNVAEKIAAVHEGILPNENPVSRISSDYYVVNVNTIIDANILEHYLKQEFTRLNMMLDYEYAIYDCSTNEMVYGNYVSASGEGDKAAPQKELPRYDKYTYYFGIHFPTRSSYLTEKMGIWIFSSGILLIVIVFFGYALAVILRQSRLSEIQKDFVNNMTHEFKTPISTIAISADVISRPDIAQQPQQLANYAAIIKSENNRLLNQVEKVLQMAHSDKRRVKLQKEEVDVHALLRLLTENFQMKAEAENGSFRCVLDAERHIVSADKLHLTNIIFNLLDNAFKYSRDHIAVMIKTENSGNSLLLSVSDEGQGIGKEHHKKIFDKFYRVPTGNVHDVKGFGIGLSYVKNIVDAHKWKLRLESEPGKGSTFTIVIPL